MWQSLAEIHFLLNAQSPSLSFFPYHSRVKLIYFSFWNQDYTLNTVFLGRMPHHFHQSHLYFKSWSPRRPCKRRSSLDYESSFQIHIPTLIYFIYQDITFYFPLFNFFIEWSFLKMYCTCWKYTVWYVVPYLFTH